MSNKFKKLFFTDSKRLDRMTPFVLWISSDSITAKIVIVTFFIGALFTWWLPVVACLAIIINGSFVGISWLFRIYLLERLLIKSE